MPRRTTRDDDWDEDDPEWDDDADDFNEVSEDEDLTITCPYCRRQIHEDAQRCPYCEQYLSDEDAPPTPKPWWIVLGALLALWVVYRWIFQ